ncbi:MAG: hypothetical protein AAF616_01890 [Bacteroidota bacterium]
MIRINFKKLSSLGSVFIVFVIPFALKAQNINYETISADVDRYRGSVSIGAGGYLSSLTGAGLSAHLVGNYDLRPVPLVARLRADVEFLSAGTNDIYDGRITEIEGGVLFPLIPGKKKTKPIKFVTDNYTSGGYEYTKYFYPEGGQVKTDLNARGGLYYLGVAGARNIGFTAGVGLRNRKHIQVKLNDGTYTIHKETQFYLEGIVTPVTKLATEFNVDPEPDPNRSTTKIGARVGWIRFERGGAESIEISARPFDDTYIITIGGAYTFGKRF